MLQLLHQPFEAASARLGPSPDELKIIFSFLLSYPLSGLLKRVPDARPERKNLFIIGSSVFILVGLFDLWHGLVTLFISAAGAFCIAKFLRPSPYMPWIGFLFLMAHMSVSHLRRQAVDNPSVVDITGAQMVLLMKLSAFCWNLADGQLPPDQLSAFQKDRALAELPSVLDFAAYVLFFPGLLAGPAFDYAEYRRWIDTSMFDLPADVDPAKKPPVRKKRRIPRSGTPATFKALAGLLWIFLYALLSPRLPPDLLLARPFTRHSFLARVALMYLVNLVSRFKYYGVWSLTEGACILAGLGYNGIDPVTGRVSWDRLRNIDPWRVETAQNPRGLLAGWNMNTNNWLRNYVYLRVTPRGKKPGFRASITTFVTSALWHGFYPGYYLTFVLASLVQTAAKKTRRLVRPFFLDPVTGDALPSKTYYDIASWLITQLTFSFATTPFILLAFSSSLKAWSRVYYYAFAWTLAALLFFASPAASRLRRRLERRQGKANAKLLRSLSSDSLTGREPILGISKDLQSDVNEAVAELRAEVEARQVKKES